MRVCCHCHQPELAESTGMPIGLREIRLRTTNTGVLVSLHKGCWWDIEHQDQSDQALEQAGPVATQRLIEEALHAR